jgi:hypothetical protein
MGCDFELVRLPLFPDEADPPAVVDSDTVLALSVSDQLFETISWRDPKVGQFHSRIDHCQFAEGDPMDCLGELPGWDSAEQHFGCFASETLDHGDSK